jgi:hypothetical protein
MDADKPVRSPTCSASQAPDGYMGFAERDELIAELNALLEAERAGARVGARLIDQAKRDAEYVALAEVIRDDEVKWCGVLFAALTELGAKPTEAVGDFYEKTMAIEGIEDRIAFVNRGQGWVVRKLEKLLPRILDDRLHGALREMLDAHVVNIAAADDTLARRGFTPAAKR